VLSKKPSQVHPADRLILEVAHMCKLVLGSSTAIHIDHILPHFLKPDIIICLDENNTPVEPEPILSKIPVGTLKPAPTEPDNLKWIAVVLATRNQMITDSNEYVGPIMTKVRQLRKFGYDPIVVPFNHWINLQTLEAKQNYLRKTLPISADSKLSSKAI